jgi:hypothetical protein
MSETLENTEHPKRPTFLKVLCILTFISTGLAAIGVLIQLMSGKMSPEQLEAFKVKNAEQIALFNEWGWDFLVELTEQSEPMMMDVQANFYLVVAIGAITTFLGLFGALQMWKGRKIGFHLYIVYNLISISSVYTYTSPANVPMESLIIGLIISGGFIFMYSRNLHWLK